MNAILKSVLKLKHGQIMKENIHVLKELRKREWLPLFGRPSHWPGTSHTSIGRCLQTYAHLIAFHQNNWTLSVSVENESKIPSIPFIDDIVQRCIRDHYDGDSRAYLFTVRSVKTSPTTVTINITKPESLKRVLLPITFRNRVESRLALNLQNLGASINNKRVVLFGDNTKNEQGILYNFPNNIIFSEERHKQLSKMSKGHNLALLECYFVVCNFVNGTHFKSFDVHQTRFESRIFPNKYESELFKIIGPVTHKPKISLRSQQESIAYMETHYHLNKWYEWISWRHMHMCGSAVLGALDSTFNGTVYPVGDVDIFNASTLCNKKWKKLVRKFMQALERTHTIVNLTVERIDWYAFVPRIKIAVFWKDTSEHTAFDFVFIPTAEPLIYPTNRFDISLAQCSFDGKGFYCTNAFKESIKTNTFTSCNFGGKKEDLCLQLQRPYKYVSRGYNLLVSNDMDETEVCAIESILQNVADKRLDQEPIRDRLTSYSAGMCRLKLDMYQIQDKFMNLI